MICISHDSAIRFWENPNHYFFLRNKIENELFEKCCTLASGLQVKNSAARKKERIHDICEAYNLGESGLLHLLVSKNAYRGKCPNVNNHVLAYELPKYSFRMISEDVLVVSPELALLQVGAQKSIPEIVKLACELNSSFSINHSFVCGINNLSSDNDADGLTNAIISKEPVSNFNKMGEFVSSVANVGGVKKFRRAIKYVPNGSAASPMEISLALLLSLPSGYGGFGLPKPEFNGDVLFGNEAASVYGHSKCVCDLLWANEKVDVEYNSDAMHANPTQMLRDSERALALECDGYRVVSVTKQQLFDRVRAKHIACQVGKMLGRRVRIQRKGFDALQSQLLHVLGLRK
jgi:hypothetical protein